MKRKREKQLKAIRELLSTQGFAVEIFVQAVKILKQQTDTMTNEELFELFENLHPDHLRFSINYIVETLTFDKK